MNAFNSGRLPLFIGVLFSLTYMFYAFANEDLGSYKCVELLNKQTFEDIVRALAKERLGYKGPPTDGGQHFRDSYMFVSRELGHARDRGCKGQSEGRRINKFGHKIIEAGAPTKNPPENKENTAGIAN